MKINPGIFKSYDIRGIYPDDLNDETAYRVGRAFVTYLKAGRVIVGKDMRISSPALFKEIVRGVTDEGADAVDVGLTTTDMFYYACGSANLPGIMVTASHNPKEYGGFKMVKRLPDLIGGGAGMEEIRDLVIGNKFLKAGPKGSVSKRDIAAGFRNKILSLSDTAKIEPQKIIVDAGNGMGGVAFDLIFRDIPIDLIRMYFEPDGTFPNHGGDPLKEENRKELQKRVVEEGADLGFAFDPDADRFFVIDKRGVFIPGDYITALMGKYMIEKNKGGKIVYDLRSSWAVRDLIKEAGGEAIENRVGHAHIKPRMQKEDAVFGGEVTGHYYFKDFYYSDGAALPCLTILEMLSHYKTTIDKLVEPLEDKYIISGEVDSKVKDADKVLVRIREKYKKDFTVYEMDGVSVVADDWHANVRKSNTEPLVRLNAEAIDNRGLMEEKRDEFLELIRG